MKTALKYVLGIVILLITVLPAIPLALIYAIHYRAIYIVRLMRLSYEKVLTNQGKGQNKISPLFKE